MAKTIKISEEVADVLRRSEITESTLTLPEQLDRGLYEATAKIIKANGGKWHKGQKTHLFDKDPRTLFADALRSGQAVNQQQLTQAFYTPAALAKEMADQLLISPGMMVLEPSAGHGALAVAVRELGASVICVEQDFDSVTRLLELRFATIHGDFVGASRLDAMFKPQVFDRIIMNPPFTGGQDIEHVAHAYKHWLRPGGRMAAIVSPSYQFNQAIKYEQFRALMAAIPHEAEDIPEKTFKESGTNIRTVLLIMRKPA